LNETTDGVGGGWVVERSVLSLPAVVMHGGAGTFERVNSPQDEVELAAALTIALDAAWLLLDAGGPALDAVVEGVAFLEDSGVFNAGRSGARTANGILELDAAVMDGSTGSFGGVLATRWPRNPVRAALAVALLGGPAHGPVLLAGEGADLFAAESGLPRMTPTGESPAPGSPMSEAGTVGVVAVDVRGHVAAATSTGGRRDQRTGRVGDSPIPGAGTWADDETVAVSATGEGEAFVVAGFAHGVDWALRQGATLEEAVTVSMSQVTKRGGEGGSISICPDGEMVCAFDTKAMARAWRDATSTTIAVLRKF
jgi:L-asparaginase / beta-aspartyl-peptidase